MICEKCNNIIDEDSKFCSKCGERILVKVEESDINFINTGYICEPRNNWRIF